MSSRSFLESLKLFLWWWCSRVQYLARARFDACGFVASDKNFHSWLRLALALALFRVRVCACGCGQTYLLSSTYARRGLRASAYVFSLSFSLVIIQALRVPVRVDFSFAQNAKLLEEELILLFEFLRGGRQRRDGGFCGFGASENLSSFGFEKF